ncbi:MAG: biopolymer transporter ExbD [Phycisphaerales bacterium]|nr:biopolymer transporter ExbD [Phycisphaerales bacterium]
MIDVTFLLIVFFVLVSQIVEVENVSMQLPEPLNPASERMADESRAVINLVPDVDGMLTSYKLGGNTFSPDDDGRLGLRANLIALYKGKPSLRVNLRADRRTEYQYIEPVLQAVSDAAANAGRNIVPRINLVVIGES